MAIVHVTRTSVQEVLVLIPLQVMYQEHCSNCHKSCRTTNVADLVFFVFSDSPKKQNPQNSITPWLITDGTAVTVYNSQCNQQKYFSSCNMSDVHNVCDLPELRSYTISWENVLCWQEEQQVIAPFRNIKLSITGTTSWKTVNWDRNNIISCLAPLNNVKKPSFH